MIKTILKKITENRDLTFDETYNLIIELDKDRLTPAQIGGFLVGFLMKGPSITEVAAIAKAMRDICIGIKPKIKGRLIDTCGTGGGLKTFNISTANAIVAAAGKIPVAKHGSRSISSSSGSADVLEALGVNVDLPPEKVAKLIEKIGIGFLNASICHPVMGKVWGPEQELGIKTIFFTIIGPLINPADAKAHVLGVYRPDLVMMVAKVLVKLNFIHAFVVHGLDGVDEISLLGKTLVAEVKGNRIEKYEIKPEDFGFERCSFEDVEGGDAKYNADLTKRIFKNEEKGAPKNMLILNAGASFVAGGKAKNLTDGVKMAKEVIEGGLAYKKLEELVRESNRI